jgi:hypothetical protein
LKDTYLWQADVNELIQELLKRKSDSGYPYFSLDVQQYHQMKFLKIKLESLRLSGKVNFEIDDK